jgi:hypothetical protein
MKISNDLDEQTLHEILEKVYKIGNESKQMNVADFIEEIKENVLTTIYKKV